MICPSCGKKMEGDSCCNMRILLHPDVETPVSIIGPKLRVDWYNAGEGICGDYDPEDPEDVNLLRFDTYYMCGDGRWEVVEDASYCTRVPAEVPEEKLITLLWYIYKEYLEVIDDYPYCSVKKLGEQLSWIS